MSESTAGRKGALVRARLSGFWGGAGLTCVRVARSGWESVTWVTRSGPEFII